MFDDKVVKRVFNTAKIYPDGTKIVYQYKKELCIPLVHDRGSKDEGRSEDNEKNDSNIFRSVRRARVTIYDCVASGNFTTFVTLTFKDQTEDREIALDRLSQFTRAMRDRYGKFAYLFVFERHKKGGIHIHGVIKDVGFNIEKSVNAKGNNIRRNGKQIYDLCDWEFGFSSFESINDNGKIARYISKYITKEIVREFGRKSYLCSKGLVRPTKITNDWEVITSSDEVDYQNDFMKVKTFKYD